MPRETFVGGTVGLSPAGSSSSEKTVVVWPLAGSPTNGTSGSFAGSAEKGDLLVDTTNAVLYINTNTKASPTWSVTGGITQAAAEADLAATTDITAVPASFADLPAVRTYLAGANVVPNIETRLDNLEAKLNAALAKMRSSGVLHA
jgi:hypothetical protein